MVIQGLIQSVEELQDTLGRVCLKKVIPPSPPRWSGFCQGLLPEIAYLLEANSITSFYNHQFEAIERVLRGENIVVSTPTASGKSLIYNIPVLQAFMKERSAKALYLFPLKALAQDQLKQLTLLTSLLPEKERPRAEILDGDTPRHKRTRLKEDPPDILITNPDMLHLSILPYHSSWAGFLKGLRFVVIDEVHTYRGIMGSNMAWVFRRLDRIARFYGKNPVYIMSSATIGNPKTLAQTLVDKEVASIEKTGASNGKRYLLFINPHTSPLSACFRLLEMALKRRLRTIVYTQSRKLTELMGFWINQRGGRFKELVAVYRAGLLPEERRRAEKGLSSGRLLGVVSTSALELGIDIGSLDCCILLGYPGSIMATWQRWGRVGRKLQDSLMILVAQEDALDQYIMRHPEVLLESPPEPAILNPDNPSVAQSHLECAASELPLLRDEPFIGQKGASLAIKRLQDKGLILVSEDGRRFFAVRRYPHKDVNLRGTGPRFRIVDARNRLSIGEIDGFRAFRETHPGAIYLHGGRTYRVKDLAIEEGVAEVEPFKDKYFTRPISQKDTMILEEYEMKALFGTFIHRGRIRVKDQVTGYEMRHVRGQRFLGRYKLDLPPQVFETEGLWIEIPDRVRTQIERAYMHFMGGIHAAEHALIHVLPLLVLTDRNDFGGISQPMHPQVGKGAIFIYDGVPGGVGLTREAFKASERLLEKALGSILSCPCETGCPSCVHSPKCGSGNRPIDKEAAIWILKMILKGEKPRPRAGTQKPVSQMGPTGREDKKDKMPEAIMDLSRMRYGVLDLETQLSAQEVGGWHKAHKMKVSCVVLYDSSTNTYLEFLEKDVKGLVEMLKGFDLVVGFNIKRFDYKVLSAYCDPLDLKGLPTIDILEEVKARLGYRLSLDHLASSTLGARKKGNGLLALRWWREGRLKELLAYCKEDVRLTKDLFVFGHEKGYLVFKNKAGSLVRVPITWTYPLG